MNPRIPWYLLGTGGCLINLSIIPIVLAVLRMPQAALQPSLASCLLAGAGIGLSLAAGWVWLTRRSG